MSSKFRVTFRNRLNEDGLTYEYPTDQLNTNGATIEYFDSVGSEIRKGENFARETWEYEVDDADRFAGGLRLTPTVMSFKCIKK